MRLIDADALPIKHLEPGKTVTREYTVVWNYAASLVEAAPTIDAVPVVRCKDCKYSIATLKPRQSLVVFCDVWCNINPKDGYCNCGVRRDDE